MASNAPAPAPSASGTTTKPSPLADFDQVSKIVYLYRPATSSSSSSSSSTTRPAASDGARNPSDNASSPKLIVLGGWMDAQPPHLAKYTAKLQALYPASPILLVRAFHYHFTTGTTNFPAEIAPAVPLIRALVPPSSDHDNDNDNDYDNDNDDNNVNAGAAPPPPPPQKQRRRPEMLVLVFSNGGATMLRYLYQLFRTKAQPQQPQRLPRHLTIFDSAPGGFAYRRSVAAFTLSASRPGTPLLRRLLTIAAAHTLAVLYWLGTAPWGRAGFLERLAAAHNNARGVDENRAEVARTYVYSEADALVDWRFVEAHAAQARARGFEVALERFEGTAHVAHVRGDEGRYWAIVGGFWERWAGV